MTVQGRSALHAHVTPLESIACPLTPPPTNEKLTSTILRIIKDIKKAKTGGDLTGVPTPWAAYTLDIEGYADLEQRLQADTLLAGFVETKLRLDYFPSTSRLVHRMPTLVHEVFTAKIVEKIQEQLKAFKGNLEHFAKKIITGASSRIKFEDLEYGPHDPDAQFRHLEAQYLGVVIEVSFTQKKRDLPHLANDYILGSESNIQMVVGIDIECGSDKEKMATISVWEPRVVLDNEGESVLIAHQTVNNQAFRDKNGDIVSSPNSDLQIPLRAFAPETLFNEMEVPEGSITISAKVLYDFLQTAEEQASVIQNKTGAVKPAAAKTWSKKRRREITPPEELHPRDETRFQTEEDNASERYMQEDSSYKGSSTSEDIS